MSSPFLVAFVGAVVARLEADEQIEIEVGETSDVIARVAARLAKANKGESLISTLSSAFLACEAVVELYVDDMELKELITELPFDTIPRGGAR